MLYDVFDEPQYYYLVTEKMQGGELFDRIVQKSYYNEKEARDTCKIIFEAIQYCHDRSVAHRDLKPENLLLVGENDSDIKIADFGFAKVSQTRRWRTRLLSRYRNVTLTPLVYSCLSVSPSQTLSQPSVVLQGMSPRKFWKVFHTIRKLICKFLLLL
jgi:serine/threonine protein kinase